MIQSQQVTDRVSRAFSSERGTILSENGAGASPLILKSNWKWAPILPCERGVGGGKEKGECRKVEL